MKATRDAALTVGAALVSALAVALVHKPLVDAHHDVHETSDVYWLPPPDDVVRMSLGYRAAMVDFIWAHILVEQGLHTYAKRRYDNVARLLDTINALEPTFREPYLLADTLITFQPGETSEDEVRKAREIMERGARNRPNDAEIWHALGAFTAFIAPYSYLHDPAEQERWRREGAEMLARAGELSGENASIAWGALGGANVLLQQGQNEAAVQFLEKVLATTDDAELKARVKAKLEALKKSGDAASRALAERATELVIVRQARMASILEKHYPFVDASTFLVLGPPKQPYLCAGDAHADKPECARTWREWSERVDEKSGQ